MTAHGWHIGYSSYSLSSCLLQQLADMKKIDSYFKTKSSQDASSSILDVESEVIHEREVRDDDSPPLKIPRIAEEESPSQFERGYERDPRKRKMIWDYPVDKRNEVRRFYLSKGPYQANPSGKVDKYKRKFLSSWYKIFPWLEYSPTTNAAYCHNCFIFAEPSNISGSNTFVVQGFRSWKKVREGNNCAFLGHEGGGPNSSHKRAVGDCENLLNSLQHIDKIVDKQSSEQVAKNRLRLKVSIDCVRFCALRAIAFRGHDESVDSHNRGNFVELVKHIASYNSEVASLVLENAPENATYTSPRTQKEILLVYARKIQRFIREEIDIGKFCIMVDESRDESKREQMAIVLRFVDKLGIIRERFFDIVHVEDTKSATLKKAICNVLSQHNLDIQNIRGQGYDGASNMRGEWNGLQALFRKECPHAYYVHCFAHRLQLILVAAAKIIIPIENFFSIVNLITNAVDSSSKRHDQLQIAQAIRIAEEINDLEIGKRKHQIRNITRPGDTRWGSHLRSPYNLLELFDSVLIVLSEIINDDCVLFSRAAADGAYEAMMSFDFVLVLHFMIELLGKTDRLCELLQCKNQDILNAMDATINTREVIQNFKENGWDKLYEKVKIFCTKHDIDIPNLSSVRKSSKGRKRKENPVTLEHYYRIDIFTGTIDCILQEMETRFNEDSVELLKLSSALDPRGGFKLFSIADLTKLVEKFYPSDFTSQEKLHLPFQLETFEV